MVGFQYTQYPQGYCPIQAEGYLLPGMTPFYFRARGEYASMWVLTELLSHTLERGVAATIRATYSRRVDVATLEVEDVDLLMLDFLREHLANSPRGF